MMLLLLMPRSYTAIMRELSPTYISKFVKVKTGLCQFSIY